MWPATDGDWIQVTEKSTYLSDLLASKKEQKNYSENSKGQISDWIIRQKEMDKSRYDYCVIQDKLCVLSGNHSKEELKSLEKSDHILKWTDVLEFENKRQKLWLNSYQKCHE